jgi:serine/threonine-protein kinase
MNSSSSSPYPVPGDVIDGKYQIEKMLGEGGMGAVAKAQHLLRRAPVALKFMSPNVMTLPGAVERFLNEGVAASQIDSDHVVHIFDVGKLPSGSPYLVMEFMEGKDIAEVLAREGQPGLDVARSIYFIVQVLRGLQVAHDAGIIHRDMKPSNAFVVNKEGEPDFVKLLDFGISKVGQGKSASLTQTNSALGTPLYMSPEQAKSPKDVDLRSDLYSVGVILYELLTGRTPFNSESGEFTEILFKLFTQDAPPVRSFRPELPDGLAAAVHKGIAREPKDRYQTAAEFAIALEAWADPRAVRVIQRLRVHQPGRGSQLPSEGAMHAAPSGMAAFSQLGVGMASPQAHTAEMGIPSGVQAHAAAATPVRSAQGAAQAVTDADAVAATQYGGASGVQGQGPSGTQALAQAGKQTDLGAARDTSTAGLPLPAPEKKLSPVVIAIPLLVLMGAVGGYFKLTAKPPADTSAAAGLAADVPAPPPPPVAPVISAPPAPSVAPSASASAAASVSAAPKKAPPTAPPPPSSGRTHLKDLKVVE